MQTATLALASLAWLGDGWRLSNVFDPASAPSSLARLQRSSLNKEYRLAHREPVLSASDKPTLDQGTPEAEVLFPTHVSDFAVKPVSVRWSAEFPGVTTLAVSSAPDTDGFLSSELRAQSELQDAHGVLGNWPSARVVAMQLAALDPSRRRRVLELGAGAGLPSLVAALALSGVERVLATDIEPFALDLLAAAHDAQATASAARLETRELDVCDLEAARATLEDQGGFDVIVVADMLYNHDVAVALGKLLGSVVAHNSARMSPAPRLIVCDSVRLVRSDFVEAFRSASGHADAAFADVDVPTFEGDDSITDLFISQEKPRVSMLRWHDDDADDH